MNASVVEGGIYVNLGAYIYFTYPRTLLPLLTPWAIKFLPVSYAHLVQCVHIRNLHSTPSSQLSATDRHLQCLDRSPEVKHKHHMAHPLGNHRRLGYRFLQVRILF